MLFYSEQHILSKFLGFEHDEKHISLLYIYKARKHFGLSAFTL